MARFLGSQFFSDTKSLERQAFVSREYELPIFINNRFLKTNPDPRWRQQIRHHAQSYSQYYKCKKRVRPTAEPRNLDMFRRLHLSTEDRFKESERNVGLPPNRLNLTGHNLANIIHKSAGKKGPYACFSGKRDDTSIIGKKAPSKFKGSNTMFYDVPDGLPLVNHPRNYFRMKMRHGSRFHQKPYSRFMLSDLTLCPKDRDFPGPGDCMKSPLFVVTKLKCKPQRPPSLFFPSSCVPQNLRFWSNQTMSPGPGRYNPDIPACPCPRGTHYSGRVFEIVHHHNRPHGPRHLMKPCRSPLMRSIPGNGHTFVFRSNVVRLLTIDSSKRKPRKTSGRHNMLQMEHDAKYLKMIGHPKRQPISRLSFDLDELQMKPAKIRFNAVERTSQRNKLRNNKRVAFMSGCPRWSVNAMAILLTDKRSRKHAERKSPNVRHYPRWRPTVPTHQATAERLLKLPTRYRELMPKIDNSDKMRYTFEPLPPPRILVQDKMTIDKDALLKVNQPFEPINFYKPEVLELRNEYLENMRLYIENQEKEKLLNEKSKIVE